MGLVWVTSLSLLVLLGYFYSFFLVLFCGILHTISLLYNQFNFNRPLYMYVCTRIVKSFLINKFIFVVLYLFSPHLCSVERVVKYLKANNQNFNTFLFAQYKNITIFTEN